MIIIDKLARQDTPCTEPAYLIFIQDPPKSWARLGTKEMILHSLSHQSVGDLFLPFHRIHSSQTFHEINPLLHYNRPETAVSSLEPEHTSMGSAGSRGTTKRSAAANALVQNLTNSAWMYLAPMAFGVARSLYNQHLRRRLGRGGRWTCGGGGNGDGGGVNIPLFGSGAAGGIEGRSPIEGGDGYSSSEYSSDDDEFMEPALSMEQRVRLAQLWVANPSNSHELTHGLGGVL